MPTKTPEHLADKDLDQVKGGARAVTFEVDHPIFSVDEAFLPASGSSRLD